MLKYNVIIPKIRYQGSKRYGACSNTYATGHAKSKTGRQGRDSIFGVEKAPNNYGTTSSL
jgi:hypothetical protein